MKKKKHSKKSFVIVGLVILGVLLIGGGGYFLLMKNSQLAEKVLPKPTPTPTPTPVIKIVNPSSKTRPVAIMINNITVARPYQSGLNDAYLVYEIIVEGGITRMMAVFKDKETARVGSVRSARHYYLDYALENDAIYTHFGGSPQAFSDITKLGVDTLNDGSNIYWRDKTLRVSSEHTAFTSLVNINKALANKNYRKETNKDLLLNYQVEEFDLPEETAQIANNVDIVYSTSHKTSYVYNPETKLYNRVVNGKPHIDYVSKEQFTTKNIITYQVNNYALNDGSGKGRQDIKNVGSGKGYYITNGKAVSITWEKSSRSNQTVYKTTDGKELNVNDGNTYIQIQPTNQKLTIS